MAKKQDKNLPHVLDLSAGELVDLLREHAESIMEAQVFMHGEVKWDGCSNWHFDEQDRVMIHGCSRSDLTSIGEIMAKCWDIAKDLIPTFDGTQ